MKSAVTLVLFASLLLLGACRTAQPTAYAPADTQDGFGFSEEQIDPTTWKIRFAGNAHTSRAEVERYAMLRAATLTQEQGQEGFVVLGEDVERQVRYNQHTYPPLGFGAYGYGAYGYRPYGYGPYGYRPYGYGPYGYRPYGYGPYPHAYGPYQTRVTEIDRYNDVMTIRTFSGPPPEGLGPAFNASEVIATITPQLPPKVE